VRLALLFIPVCVFCFLFVSVFPCLVLVWFFLWLPGEDLTLLFLLHRENGDFSILMKDIVWSGISLGLASCWLKLGDFLGFIVEFSLLSHSSMYSFFLHL
jgi:hypothetical protein